MENEDLLVWMMGGFGGLAGVMVVFLIYLLKMFDAVEERVDRMSGKLENAVGRLSIIQDMFKDLMGRLALDGYARGLRGDASAADAGESEEAEKAGGDARRSAPASPPSGTRP